MLFASRCSNIGQLQVIAGEKLIVTAGAIDAHVHYICTDLWKEASSTMKAINSHGKLIT
jgi:urease alpha subunit